MRKLRRLTAAAGSAVIAVSVLSGLSAWNVSAAGGQYTSVDETTNTKVTNWSANSVSRWQMLKEFEINKDANIPAASFSFQVTPGSAVTESADTFGVLPGPNPEKITYKIVGVKYTKDETTGTISNASFLDEGTTALTANGATAGKSEFTLSYLKDDVTLGAAGSAVNGIKYDAEEKKDVLLANDEVNSNYYKADKKVEFDFSKCVFEDPGIYRYLITEVQGTESYISYDRNKTKVLDVQVDDASDGTGNKLQIDSYQLYNVDDLTAVPGPAKETAADPDASGDTDADTGVGMKTEGFVNRYLTQNLTFEKAVTGNQGSKDKYFKFSVTLAGLPDAAVLDLSLGTDAEIAKNPNQATKCAALTTELADGASYQQIAQLQAPYTGTQYTYNAETNTIQADFYLHDTQYVTILGIPAGVQYNVTEEPEEYTSKNGSDHTWNDTDKYNDDTNGTIEDKNIHTGFTNTKTGTIPTGVLLAIARPALCGAAVLGMMILLAFRIRKRRTAED